MKSRKRPSALDLEKILGLVTCSFNGLNAQLKKSLDDDSRALFLSHFALLAEQEAKVISSPIADLIGGAEDAG